jgi:hypothetical protein
LKALSQEDSLVFRVSKLMLSLAVLHQNAPELETRFLNEKLRVTGLGVCKKPRYPDDVNKIQK